MFYKFIWNNKPDKVARKTLVQDHEKGGCRMIHIQTFIKSLKLTWIRRILNSDRNNKWCTLFLDTNNVDINKRNVLGNDYIKKVLHNLKIYFGKKYLVI